MVTHVPRMSATTDTRRCSGRHVGSDAASVVGIFPIDRYAGHMSRIGERVSTALQAAGLTQREVAEGVGMKPDALCRALNGQRGFSAIELANLGELLKQDLHYLVTGDVDPNRIVVSARHSYDANSGARTVSGAVSDTTVLEDISLAYRQAVEVGVPPSRPPLGRAAQEARTSLGSDFVTDFMARLEKWGIDVVRVEHLSTAYSMTVCGRPVIALRSSGNWFNENWSMAHELGHLALDHVGVMPNHLQTDACESQANAFAAELLMPAEDFRAQDWLHMTREELASLLWEWGVSTTAVKNRLSGLQIQVPTGIAEVLEFTTQKALRYYWSGAKQAFRDPITERMSLAAQRHFPNWLKDAHLKGIATGKLSKHTLAWMLEVDAEELEVEEPRPQALRDPRELSALLG